MRHKHFFKPIETERYDKTTLGFHLIFGRCKCGVRGYVINPRRSDTLFNVVHMPLAHPHLTNYLSNEFWS